MQVDNLVKFCVKGKKMDMILLIPERHLMPWLGEKRVPDLSTIE